MTGQVSITGRTVVTIGDQLRATFWSAPRFYRMLVAAILLAAALSFAPIRGAQSLLLSFSLILLMAALMGRALVAFSYWQLGNPQKVVTYVVDAEGIATRDATGAAISLPWNVLRGCIESKSGFAFAMRPSGTRWLVKRAFNTDEVDALRWLIKAKLGEAAGIDKMPPRRKLASSPRSSRTGRRRPSP